MIDMELFLGWDQMYVLFAVLAIVATLCGNALGQRAHSDIPTGIFGEKDERVQISSDKWPWVAIGRLNVIAGTARQLCTGTVIAPRRVLTAAQCLFDGATNTWVRPSSVHFVISRHKERRLGHSVIESFTKSPDFAYRMEDRPRWDAIDPEMIRHNWAILLLRDQLPVRPIPLRTSRLPN
jgi:protease YdgD